MTMPLNMSASLNFSVSNFYPLTYLRYGMLISLMLASLIGKVTEAKNQNCATVRKSLENAVLKKLNNILTYREPI